MIISLIFVGCGTTGGTNGSAYGTDKSQSSYLAYNLTVSLGYVLGK